MHLEEGLWNAFGDLLEDSTWTTALIGVASSVIADSLTQVCHSHKTALALATMQLRLSRSITLIKIMKNDYGKCENIPHFLWISYYILILIWAHSSVCMLIVLSLSCSFSSH